MLENLANAVVAITRNMDVQKEGKGAVENFLKAFLFKDVEAGVDGIINTQNLIFQVPTALFWDKMQRYLFGTFKCYEDQIKMAEKFNSDNAKYAEFVKRQIYLIDKMDDDLKVDYFANLTRCFLLNGLSTALYYKLANYINMCTVEELKYIKNFDYDRQTKINVMIASLYQYGLFEQNGEYYNLSDFSKALKMSSLNYDEGTMHQKRIRSYEDMEPLKLIEPLTWKEIDEITDN